MSEPTPPAVPLPATAVAFVTEEAPLGHVVTLGVDGAPDVTVAWFDADADGLVMATLFDQRKLRNMRRDPRVTVSFQSDAANAIGMRHYLVVDGTAEMTAGGAPQLLHDLAQRYVGPGTVFPPMEDPPPGFLIRITPTRVRGIGPWAE